MGRPTSRPFDHFDHEYRNGLNAFVYIFSDENRYVKAQKKSPIGDFLTFIFVELNFFVHQVFLVGQHSVPIATKNRDSIIAYALI